MRKEPEAVPRDWTIYAPGSPPARNASGIGSNMGWPVSSSAFSSRMAVGRRTSSPRGRDVLLRRERAEEGFLGPLSVAAELSPEAGPRGAGDRRSGLGAAGTGLPNRHKTATKNVPAKSQIKRCQRIGTRPMCAQPSANYETKVATKISPARTAYWARGSWVSALGVSEPLMDQELTDSIYIGHRCRRTPRSPGLRRLPVSEGPTMGRRDWKQIGGFR